MTKVLILITRQLRKIEITENKLLRCLVNYMHMTLHEIKLSVWH